MFQMTRNFDHDEDLEGILKLLKYLNLEEKVKAEPSFAKLIFVVPSAMSDTFKKQKITKDPVFEGKSRAQVLASDCIEMPGIGREKKRKLNSRGIRQVLEAYDSGKHEIQFIKSAISTFQENFSSLQDVEHVEQIHQYVIGIDYHLQELVE
jgi:hypothetical protein